MGFNCGIVGLPNVGKSALFNALTATQAAEATKYPFSTREANVGRVAVPDERLEMCARLARSAKIIPTQLEFIDIAGLVRGASKGQGLGNQFLGHLRQVDAIAHIARCFEDENVVHVEGSVDPIRDVETVETELMLADLDSLERRSVAAEKRARGGDREGKLLLELIEPALAALRAGQPARQAAIPVERRRELSGLQLLTAKPTFYIANVDEAAAASGNDASRRVAEYAAAHGSETVVISAAIEAELAVLADPGERREFLAALGLGETGLDRVIRTGYGLLDLITFLTAGPKESRAWTITRGTKAPQAARVIHSDFEKGFIRAETISYADFVAHGGEQGAKDAGRMRLEGADYMVRDGDVMHFRFNV
ncbi:MAG: redox-regulated ATPase YchF [Stellaceae bacterium]